MFESVRMAGGVDPEDPSEPRMYDSKLAGEVDDPATSFVCNAVEKVVAPGVEIDNACGWTGDEQNPPVFLPLALLRGRPADTG
jgi:hypothetical protein